MVSPTTEEENEGCSSCVRDRNSYNSDLILLLQIISLFSKIREISSGKILSGLDTIGPRWPIYYKRINEDRLTADEAVITTKDSSSRQTTITFMIMECMNERG